MRTKYNTNKNNSGFTILEIIVTIVVAAILGTVLVQVMSTSLTRSSVPITLLKNTFSLSQIIEEMTADYKNLLETDSDPLTTLQGYINNGNDDANTPYYGQYSIDYIGYIKFDGSYNEIADTSGDDTTLKATISSNNQSLTVLFTK